MNPVGYGATWREALYRGSPMAVPDIIKRYPRAPRTTVRNDTRFQGGMQGMGVNTLGPDTVQIAVDMIYNQRDPSYAMTYLNDPSIALTADQAKSLNDAIQWINLTAESQQGADWQGPVQSTIPESQIEFPWLLVGIGAAALYFISRKKK
jgi:hypothetical protein